MSYPSFYRNTPPVECVVTEHGAVKKSINVAAGQTLARGTIMAQKTAGGQFYPYSHAASDGTQFAVGILAQNVNTTAAGNVNNPQVADMYVSGKFWYSKLTGTDSFFAALFSSFQQQQISKSDILSF